MTKVTVASGSAPGACSIARRLNNLHRIVSKKSPKDLSFPSCRREARFHVFRGLSHPPIVALSCRLFVQRFTDRVYRHLPSGALRPNFQFEFDCEFEGRVGAGSNAPNFNVASSNFGAESGVWQCARWQARPRRTFADLQPRDRASFAPKPRGSFIGVQHHRGAGREMAEAQRPAPERQRDCAGGGAEAEPGSTGTKLRDIPWRL